MEYDPNNLTVPGSSELRRRIRIKVFGVGGAGCNAVDQMLESDLTDVVFIQVNTDVQALDRARGDLKINLGARLTRGLGTGGDPEMGKAAAHAEEELLRQHCREADFVFIVTGLGGGTGTGASPILARIAQESGALVMGVATLPFECEGHRRQRQAQEGLAHLRREGDGVICLPNQKVFSLIDENTSLVEAFQITNDLLLEGVRGIWRLLVQPGIINVDFADLASVLRDRHGENCFASAIASGANRSKEIVDALLENPLLDGPATLEQSDTVLVSLIGGENLALTEVNRVMEQLNRHCPDAHLIMGAAIDAGMKDRLEITVIASQGPAGSSGEDAPGRLMAATASGNPSDTAQGPGFDTQYFAKNETVEPRIETEFLAPAPEMSEEKKKEMLARQKKDGAPFIKTPIRWKQTTLPLEIVSKGRFEKSEPTVYQGEDLDIPTYVRRGVILN